MANIDKARAAALIVRLDKSLDTYRRFSDDTTPRTTRERLDAGLYAYRVLTTERDGSITRGLITVKNAAQAVEESPAGGRTYYPNPEHPLQGLRFAATWECPKLIFDFVDLPTVTITPDSFEVETVITDAEWAHLTGN